MVEVKGSFQSFGRLFKQSKEHHKGYYLGAIYSFWKKFFDIAPEILIGVAIDVVVNQEKSFLSSWGIVEPLRQLVLLSVLTLLIWILESIFEYLLLLQWKNLAQDLQHDLRLRAYTHLQKVDMSYFEDQSTGALVSTLNDDINQLERFFNEGMDSLVQIMASVLLIGSVFFILAPQIALLAFVPMPFILFGAVYFQKKAAPLYSDVREKAGVIGARLANNISGIATIRSFTAEEKEIGLVSKDSLSYVHSNRKAIVVSSRFNPLIRMGVLIGFLATFVVGGIMTLKGDLNVGSYGALVFLTQRLLWPMRDLAKSVDLFERAMASADRVLDILDIPMHLEIPKSIKRFSADYSVLFQNVSFSYSNGIKILENFNLNIPSAKTLAIVGATGSGKSTITKLILNFYKPTKGKVFVGGVDTQECDPSFLRSQVGLVSQDIFLFHGTIYDNIAYGNPSASKEEVIRAAQKAHIHEFIESLPQGMDTMIGERGQKLSGGQRQRISIARVILKNPPILILDEATSAVDNETESLIQKSLKDISKNRTTIIIAHRLSTVTHAHSICVLSHGKIVEQGSHSELLGQNQIYSQLWNLQTRESSLEI